MLMVSELAKFSMEWATYSKPKVGSMKVSISITDALNNSRKSLE